MAPTFLELPPELILAVLARLPAPDIAHVRACCSQRNSAVRGSLLLQYHLACYLAGVRDNPHAPHSLSDRLALLQAREAAWAALTPAATRDVAVPPTNSTLYDFSNGVFVLGADAPAGGYSYMHLPSIAAVKALALGAERPLRWTHVPTGGVVMDINSSVPEDNLVASTIMCVFLHP